VSWSKISEYSIIEAGSLSEVVSSIHATLPEELSFVKRLGFAFLLWRSDEGEIDVYNFSFSIKREFFYK